jgi:hypothetical protein
MTKIGEYYETVVQPTTVQANQGANEVSKNVFIDHICQKLNTDQAYLDGRGIRLENNASTRLRLYCARSLRKPDTRSACLWLARAQWM